MHHHPPHRGGRCPVTQAADHPAVPGITGCFRCPHTAGLGTAAIKFQRVQRHLYQRHTTGHHHKKCTIQGMLNAGQ